MAERAPVILLPPSAGKSAGGRRPAWRPGTGVLPALDDARATVLAALGDGIADAPCRPAIERYTGVLYAQLDWASLPASAKRLGARTVLIASGVWGVSAPRDPIPEYRLAMSDRLAPLGRLSLWWRPRLTEALGEHLAGRLVWDLLPNEHAAAWLPGDVPYRRRVTVRFVDGAGRTVSHWNKLLKGALVRHLLTERPAGPEELADWSHPSGHRLDGSRSHLADEPALAVFVQRS